MKAKSLKNLSRRPMLLAMLTLFCLLAGGLNLKAQNRSTLTVYDQNTTTNQYVPIYGYYADSKSMCEFIIPKEKISAMNGGVISAMKFYLDHSDDYEEISANFNVFVKEVSATTLTGLLGQSGATTVFNSTITIETDASNVEINIPFSSNDYVYGGGNLLIGVYQTEKTGYNRTYWTGEAQDTNTAWGGYDGSTSAKKFLPKTTFTYTPGTTPYISLAPSSATVLTGFTETLTATTLNVTGTPTITYTSSNTNVATVSSSGTTATVMGVSAGTATITASMTYQGITYTATCAITVEDPSYCKPSFSNTSDFIKSFTTNGGEHNISNTNSGQGTGGYSDFYNSHYVSAEPGTTISFSVVRGYDDTYQYGLWVDWNKDYVFDNSTEKMASTSSAGDWSSSFTIPANTAAGDYHMRVLQLYGSSYTLAPCVSASYGEGEDYKLTVLASGAYTITCATTTNGTITANPLTANQGATITVTATPATGYQVGSVTTTPSTTVTDNGDGTYTFTMPAYNVTVNATFQARYNITYANDGHGTQGSGAPTTAVAGSTVTVPTAPAAGYVFDHITVTGDIATSGNTFVMPDNAVTVTLYFVEGGSGIEGQVVTLDDRENHSWSYYSDGDQPIHRLNPADIKITYFGNGTRNMTNASENGDTPTSFSADATGVQVNVGETEKEHTFVYYKTLEKANEDGTGNYPYTLIPNPFQKRPTNGTTNKYRGFYKWRVKSLSNGLTITDGSHTYGLNDTISAEREIQFVTTAAYGNEVEFEALWAQAYVTTTTNTSGLNANVSYERNFMVLSSSPGTLDGISVPLTITTCNPDGTGSSTTVSLSNSINCGADLKIENIKMSEIGTLSANGHNLVVGRGVTSATSGGYCATYVKGLNDDATSPNYRIRLESGVYDIVSMIEGYYQHQSSLTVYGTPKVSLVLGSDYDRATEKYTDGNMSISNKLDVKKEVRVGHKVTIESTSTIGKETFKVWVKSGKIGSSHDMNDFEAGLGACLYLASSGTATYDGYRKLFIEGGEISAVAGGMDKCYTSETVPNNTKSVTIRMTNGHVRSAIYGGAAEVPSGGDKEIIVTGGVVTGWIGAGCNGTADTRGQTYGEGFVYFGGDALSGGTGSSFLTNGAVGGTIFGAGNGRATATTSGEMTFGTNVVIADECVVERDVYGGGNYGYAKVKSNVHILGGTIGGNVFGGANQKSGPFVNVTMKKGEVSGSVYGGSNTTGNITGLATVKVSGGTINGNVFGGGCGANTDMTTGSVVNINDGSIDGNVYGGGEQGTSSATVVTVSGGTISGSVYGGGEAGDIEGSSAISIVPGTLTFNLSDSYGDGWNGASITVSFSDGTSQSMTISSGYSSASYTVNVGSDVYVTLTWNSGKNDGYYDTECSFTVVQNEETVLDASTPASQLPVVMTTISNATAVASTVNVSGGNIAVDVFGGGKLGTTNGNTIVNIEGDANVGQHVYGGALGTSGSVMITGNKTVNIMGGAVKGSVYGGSRNANDSNDSYVNISGGTVGKNVYGGGFYGSITGNTYVNIGKDAIENSPCEEANTSKPASLSVGNLNIGGSVYAGSDWGEFTAGSTFTPSNITGASNIYVDANGYSDGSLIIGNSIYGSGTSGDAGTSRDIIIRNYGTMTGTNGSSASRKLYTIQRADRVILDNAHIELTGKGNIASASTTEQFGISDIFGEFRMANGSSLVLDAPVDNTKAAGSYVCANTFAASPTYTPVTINDLSTAAKDNKIYFKDGCYLNVYYKNGTDNLYGALSGYFHMTAENTSVGFAYARPKVVENSIAAVGGWDWQDEAVANSSDGGFVSYNSAENEYDINGNTTGELVQVQYILHPNSRNDSEFYRTWKLGTGTSKISKVITAEANGSNNNILTATVNAQLPYANGCYYKIVDVDWGDDAAMVNAGLYGTNTYALCHKSGGNYVMAYDQTASECATEIDAIKAAPNYTFGLTVLPEAGFQSDFGSSMPAALISPDAEDLWDTLRVEANTAAKPELQFMLTYANNIDASASLSPVVITLAEYDCSDNKLQNIEVSLTIQTITQIQDIETTVYAMMYGHGTYHDSSTVKVVLPKFVIAQGEAYSQFSITGITGPATPGADLHSATYFTDGITNDTCDYAMTFEPALTTDEINGWYGANDLGHCFDITGTYPADFAQADGRKLTAIDFTVHYDGRVHFENDEDELATKVFTVKISNFVENNATTTKTFNITVHIRRRGQSQNWYISSAGSNANSGHYPDQPKRSIKALMNAKPAYAVGDKIFIVDTIFINQPTVWEQPGDNSMGVTMQIYRYPGGHKLSDGNNDVTTAAPTGIQVGQYTGTLVNVNDELTLDWVYIDGQHFANPNWSDYDIAHPDVNPLHNNVVAAGPVFDIAEGGNLNLRNMIQIGNNYVTSGSKTANAGGIYMGGEMNVEGGYIMVAENYLNGRHNNVYLPDADSKIGIVGESFMGEIGVTKTAMPIGASHTPIAYSVEESSDVASGAYSMEAFFPDAPGVFTYYNGTATDDTNPYTIYFALTWVAAVTTAPDGFIPGNIDSPEDLAWFISYVNGYNGSETHAGATAKVTKDLDMKQYIWVPIGDATTAFTGSFDGNMQTIANLHCNETDGISDKFDYMGMFGQTSGATVQNTFVIDADFASSKAGSYMGGLIGKATDGTIEFCEAAGTLTALADLTSMGGVVGEASSTTMKAIMSYTDMDGNNKTITNVGGVVGTGGTLQTALADNTFTDIANPKAIGNLAVNDAYTLSTTPTSLGSSVTAAVYALAAYTGTDATGKFSYSDYSYGADNNTVGGTTSTAGTPLVDLLNNDANLATGYKWIRAAGSAINGGYPIIVKVVAEDSLAAVKPGFKAVRFGGINNMIATYADSTNAQIYMYNNGEITKPITATNKGKLYIDEHVALTQSASEVNAFVGITLDNSNGTGSGGQHRDWHMFSPSISNAATGIDWADEQSIMEFHDDNPLIFGSEPNDGDYWFTDDVISYFPTGINSGLAFDFYAFSEPDYHWINYKRNSDNHWHEDVNAQGKHEQITYTNETTLKQGEGYMVALGDNATKNNNLMQAFGTLTNANVEIDVTASGEHLKGYNLLGNPFQGYLDFNVFANENVTLWSGTSDFGYKAYLIYDADEGGFIQYLVDNNGMGFSENAAKKADRYINMHQGFFVVKNGEASKVVFNNETMRVTNQTPHFRDEATPHYPLVNLFCTDSDGKQEVSVIEVERPLMAGALKMKGMLNGKCNMYIHWDGEDFGSMFLDHTPDYVPVWFDAAEDGVFTMTWSTANAAFGYMHLIDNMTGADIDCLVDDSYVFSATTTDMSARFRLVFKPLGVPETPTEQGENFAFINGEELIVNGEGELSFVDLNGHVLARQYVTGQQTRLAIPKVAVGMYMLTLTGSDGVKVQKIVISK